MSWLRLPIDFGRSIAVLELPPSAAIKLPDVMLRILDKALRELKDGQPEYLQTAFGLIIEHAVPKLCGAQLQFYDFDFRSQSHRFGVSHPLLPRITNGAMAEKFVIGSAELNAAVATERAPAGTVPVHGE